MPARLFICARTEPKDREIPTYALLMAIWIEVISPDVGDVGVDHVPGLVMLEDGGAAQAQPIRQIHLRITSGLWTKNRR